MMGLNPWLSRLLILLALITIDQASPPLAFFLVAASASVALLIFLYRGSYLPRFIMDVLDRLTNKAMLQDAYERRSAKLVTIDAEQLTQRTARVIVQDEAVRSIAMQLRRRIAARRKDKPIAVFCLAEATGVGKTHFAKVLAEELYGSKGHQVTTDAAPAVAWLSRAAEQGEADAMFRLGIFYERAKPSTGYADPARGVALLKKCSEATLDDRCTFAYATMLENGHGVAIDLVRAYAFYRLSEDAKKTPRRTERLASLEKQFSLEDLKNGRKLARQVREGVFARGLPTSAKSSSVPTNLSGQ
jgi:hypothetical protein